MGFAETQSADPRNVRPPGPNAPAAGQRWPASDLRKRVADVVLATLLIILLLPVLLGITVVIRCDGGPALFLQTRLGAAGKSFSCLKFRTMRINAELALLDYLASNPQAACEWAEHRKLRHDPRATAFGQLLRSLSLDELPQLFNVLRGQMSLVGPRPIVADEMARYGSAIEYYFRARPGLTGLWQVSGRSDLPYAKRVELDVTYVCHHTIWLDLVILYRTVGAVLRRRGAR